MFIQFNRNPISLGKKGDEIPQTDIINRHGLFNASVEDAVMYGGDAVRHALSCMNFRNDRKNIVVDVKVHMLMPGFTPAIPGWHTDGVPRVTEKAGEKTYDVHWGTPDVSLQDTLGWRPHRYHLFVTGSCRTRFVDGTFVADVDASVDLYRRLTKQVQKSKTHGEIDTFQIPENQVVEFDWWNVHCATEADKREWRLLVRAVESDFYEPKTELREIIRTQHQVYANKEFGW